MANFLGLATSALILIATPGVALGQSSQQAPPPQASSQLVQDISKDLAELNVLIAAIPTQQPGVVSQPTIFEKSWMATGTATARVKPDSGAPQVYTIRPGEQLQILDSQNNWFLTRNQQNEVGWVPMISFGPGLSYEQALNAVLTRIQQLKQKYDASPIRISGFSLDLKMPPGVSVQFEFR